MTRRRTENSSVVSMGVVRRIDILGILETRTAMRSMGVGVHCWTAVTMMI